MGHFSAIKWVTFRLTNIHGRKGCAEARSAGSGKAQGGSGAAGGGHWGLAGLDALEGAPVDMNLEPESLRPLRAIWMKRTW